jgi:hypothetical protein
LLSVGGLVLVYRFVEVPLLQAHYGATGAIYAALYVMFGISLGFPCSWCGNSSRRRG